MGRGMKSEVEETGSEENEDEGKGKKIRVRAFF